MYEHLNKHAHGGRAGGLAAASTLSLGLAASSNASAMLCVSGEVDKMYLSLTAVSTELVSTSGGGTHSPTHSTTLTRQEGVTEAERERALHFVSQALRFALAHNSRRRDADVDAVEQVRLAIPGNDP